MLLLELPSFELIDAESVKDAVLYLNRYAGKARVFAGGTDLLGLMKDRVEGPKLRVPEVLLNIKTIPEMSQITYDKEAGLRIGSTVTLSRLETTDAVRQGFDILSQAARQVGTTQIRNMATIGGNLCQRPRCIYFRHPHFLCHRKGGQRCFAVTGEHRYYHSIMEHGKCVMVHPSDIASALAALGAQVLIATPAGQKEIPLQDFFLPANSYTETALKPGEFLTAVRVPVRKKKTYQLFLKRRIRNSTDFALSSIAIVAQISNTICEDIQIVLGGVAAFPYIASRAIEILRGRKLTEKLILKAADGSVEKARPLLNNSYKIDLTKALVIRALKSVWHNATYL